jgi:hypothetical protein
VQIDRTRVRVENCHAFGGPWTTLELIRSLGLDEFLKRTLQDRFVAPAHLASK